jgi:hypothetical protein
MARMTTGAAAASGQPLRVPCPWTQLGWPEWHDRPTVTGDASSRRVGSAAEQRDRTDDDATLARKTAPRGVLSHGVLGRWFHAPTGLGDVDRVEIELENCPWSVQAFLNRLPLAPRGGTTEPSAVQIWGLTGLLAGRQQLQLWLSAPAGLDAMVDGGAETPGPGGEHLSLPGPFAAAGQQNRQQNHRQSPTALGKAEAHLPSRFPSSHFDGVRLRIHPRQ